MAASTRRFFYATPARAQIGIGQPDLPEPGVESGDLLEVPERQVEFLPGEADKPAPVVGELASGSSFVACA